MRTPLLQIKDWELTASACMCTECKNLRIKGDPRVSTKYYAAHDCSNEGFANTRERWSYKDMQIECDICHSIVPDPIQALYVMMSGDMDE